jgi:hypothetical protein
MIRLEGLTPLQVQIADLIWNCSSQDDVDLLIKSMPTEEYRRIATVMMEMIVWAAIDEAMDDPDCQDYKAANKVINHITGRL